MTHTSPTIQETFLRFGQEGRSVLIPYLTAGYPDADRSFEMMAALAESGGDVIELGIPFSDPLADGPTIQRSSFHALEGGMTVEGVFEILRRFRREYDHPVVLFSYLNPILRFGVDAFLARAEEAGAQGLLLTDLPTGADEDLEGKVVESSLDFIRLVAPTTPPDRIQEVAASGSGFLYYISRTGVTGAREALREDLGKEVEAVRDLIDLPVAVGFGISTPEQAALVSGVSEGVVIGSALINALDEGGVEGSARLLASLRAGMDGTGS